MCSAVALCQRSAGHPFYNVILCLFQCARIHRTKWRSLDMLDSSCLLKCTSKTRYSMSNVNLIWCEKECVCAFFFTSSFPLSKGALTLELLYRAQKSRFYSSCECTHSATTSCYGAVRRICEPPPHIANKSRRVSVARADFSTPEQIFCSILFRSNGSQ